MRTLVLLGLCVALLAIGSCSRLEDTPLRALPADMVDLNTLPAEYGELVAITHFGDPGSVPGSYELWFSNAETGRVTHVQIYSPTWQYNPAKIRVIERD
jgi:hypothetical protein